MKPPRNDPYPNNDNSPDGVDNAFDRVERAVTRSYVIAQAGNSEESTDSLERLLVTLLAAIVVDRFNARSSDNRAKALADLLIDAVKEANRLGGATDKMK